ncbi:MAG: hypothetical protein NVS3B28_28830 [Candidatus Velthaea sp.]
MPDYAGVKTMPSFHWQNWHRVVAASVLGCALCAAGPTQPQQIVTAPGGALRYVVLTGVVTGSSSGAQTALAGASLKLRDLNTSAILASVITDQDGSFRFENPAGLAGEDVPPPDIPAGTYEVEARFHAARLKKRVTVDLSRTVRQDIDLGEIARFGGAAPPPPVATFYATDREQNLNATSAQGFFANKRINTPCVPAPACLMHYGVISPNGPFYGLPQPVADVAQLVVQMKSFYPNATGVLVYLHGYNNDFFGPFDVGATWVSSFVPGGVMPVIVYSWPSNAKTLKYLDDETNNTWAADHFRDFILALLDDPKSPKNVNILAHSMGNRLAIGAIDYLARSRPRTAASLNQVIFAAPDVDAGMFYEDLPAMASVARGLTIYGSTHDEALRLSRQVHGHCRAGLVGCDEAVPALANVNAIDASIFECDFLGHGYWNASTTMHADIISILTGGTMGPLSAPRSHVQVVAPSKFAFASIDPSDEACGAQAHDPTGTW